MFKQKYSITILNDKWDIIREVKMINVPKQDELIYFDDIQIYYSVIHVIHQISKKYRIILVVKEFSNKIQLSEKKP